MFPSPEKPPKPKTQNGYEVIAFEGPGQGAALKRYGLPWSIEWEKPTKAILDYFTLDDVTLLGISMGGYLCVRAAAFEPRIQRVIACSIVYDWMQAVNKVVKRVTECFLSILLRWRKPLTSK